MATKKIATKETKKIPTVTVETKKITPSKDCCEVTTTGCGSKKPMCHLIGGALLVINTVLLAILLVNQSRFEALRVGGNENFKLLKQVFVSEGYKNDQRQQIEKALQVYSSNQAQQAPAAQQQIQQQAAQAQQAPAAQQQIQQQAAQAQQAPAAQQQIQQ